MPGNNNLPNSENEHVYNEKIFKKIVLVHKKNRSVLQKESLEDGPPSGQVSDDRG